MSSETEIFARIGKGLNLYYRAVGNYDYIDDDGVGKFDEFAEDNGFEEDEVEDEESEKNNNYTGYIMNNLGFSLC